MAKYIDRELLPQYSLYNSYADKNNGWDLDSVDEGIWAGGIRTTPGLDLSAFIDLKVSMADPLEVSEIPYYDFSKIKTFLSSKEWDDIKGMRNALMLWGFKDQNKYSPMWISRFNEAEEKIKIDDINSHRYYCDFLDLHYNFFTLFRHLSIAQGHPFRRTDGSVLYPKLLLIDAELHKKCKNADFLDIDYDFLVEQTEHEVPVIVINGDSAEKKMIFTITNVKDLAPDNPVEIHILDPANGMSEFCVSNASSYYNWKTKEYDPVSEKYTLMCNPDYCHPRGAYICPGPEDYNRDFYSVSSLGVCRYGKSCSNCSKKMMRVIASVLYCYVEYKKKVLSKEQTERHYETARDKDKTQPFVPSTMIKLFDVKMTDDEYARVDKYGYYGKRWSSYVSTEKSPHVRRGTWRYNPKTGLKDIKVSGCIVHKDKFSGFTSADRINE